MGSDGNIFKMIDIISRDLQECQRNTKRNCITLFVTVFVTFSFLLILVAIFRNTIADDYYYYDRWGLPENAAYDSFEAYSLNSCMEKCKENDTCQVGYMSESNGTCYLYTDTPMDLGIEARSEHYDSTVFIKRDFVTPGGTMDGGVFYYITSSEITARDSVSHCQKFYKNGRLATIPVKNKPKTLAVRDILNEASGYPLLFYTVNYIKMKPEGRSAWKQVRTLVRTVRQQSDKYVHLYEMRLWDFVVSRVLCEADPFNIKKPEVEEHYMMR